MRTKLICIAAVITLLLIAGCSKSSSSGTASSSASSSGSGMSMGAMIDMATVAKAMQDAKSYRMTARSEAGAKPTVMTMDVECPDKMHMVTQGMEMTRLGHSNYMKVGGRWMKSPIYGQQPPVCGTGATAGVNKNLPKLPPSDMKITKGGMTTVNGVACQEWNGESEGKTMTWCIGADHRPVQIRTADNKMVMNYSDWNNVKVEAPKL